MRDAAIAAFILSLALAPGVSAESRTPERVSESGAGTRESPRASSGYLGPSGIPDYKVLLPPPPREGSILDKADRGLFHETRILEGGPRWQLAVNDSELSHEALIGDFACVFSARRGASDMPNLSRLMSRATADLSVMLVRAKGEFGRPRPFATEEGPLCEAPSERLRKSGSYPSGHAAVGWLYALILAELDPANADKILSRGRAYGESRVVCGVHFLSDIESGRMVATALVAALRGNRDYSRDVKAARAELDGKPATTERDAGSCQALGAMTKTPW